MSTLYEQYLSFIEEKGYRGALYGSLSYDVGWAIALGLDKAEKWLKKNGSRDRLSDFRYGDESAVLLQFNAMRSVRFHGLTVSGRFRLIVVTQSIVGVGKVRPRAVSGP